MAKYYGNIGFAVQEESEPGIWEDVITSRPYKGDVLRNGRRWETTDNINDDFVITNQFSIIADTFLYSHIPSMRYLEYMGVKFKITSVELDRPRVTISVGGVYVSPDSTSESTEDVGSDTGD